jgi:hypothetical protein
VLNLLRDAQAAFDRGETAGAIARAETFISAAPGHPRLADAQLLLARSRERDGAWIAAWEQYRLFLANYPTHPEVRNALPRAASLARRYVFASGRPSVTRWRVVPLASREAAWAERLVALRREEHTGVVLALGSQPDWAHVARAVDRAAVEGVRLVLWPLLHDTGLPFDPFDTASVGQMEEMYRFAAGLATEGFVVGRDLYVDSTMHPPATGRVLESVSGFSPAQNDGATRLAWGWAGMRARASARALAQLVNAVEAVRPGRLWLVAVSAVTVARPAEAILDLGEDLAELRRAAPGFVPAIVGVELLDHSAIGAGLSRLGFVVRPFVWTRDGDLVELSRRGAS